MNSRVGIASRRGTRAHNMDAAAAFEAVTGDVAVAVVDGIGNDPDGSELMQLICTAAARIAASRGALAGVLTAAALIDADPGTDDYGPDAVMVLAVSRPGYEVELAWVGDSHIYSWDGVRLARRTTPHTMGEYLRLNGESEQLAVRHDNWTRMSLTIASPTTVALAEAPAHELLILLSDGLDGLLHGELAAAVAEHAGDPQTLAEALVAAARPSGDYRDDATAVVLAPNAEASRS
ncbi:SpoIIE family protein phosphatase [Kribbella sandramycini]|uniref:Serine/threonine protein phosphatase PrpC n=2 Tax=Kribbella sandramycini TaxID=60450 RepID=A0A841SNI9_9ACTN|nr:serine/threonine protein phosphatase PrpC [Kribbella sandramycini]